MFNKLIKLKELIVIDDSDSWTEEDQNDLAVFSLQHGNEALTDDEELV
ncbi:MAG: hypothetical protein AB4041_18880 [Microcystaceae cyanobacterium]